MMLATAKLPLSQRINFRILLLAAVALAIVGVPLAWYLQDALSGGIRHRSDGYIEVNLKAMSSFVFNQTAGTLEDVPERFRALDGKRVILEGEMWAPNTASDQISQFAFVYSIGACCFSGPPQIQHFVQSVVVNSGQVPYYSGQVRAYGTLRVRVTRDEAGGQINGVYHLEVERIEPVT